MSRPLYVPSKRRHASSSAAATSKNNKGAPTFVVGANATRNQPPSRFHGAFTGGFSAGYFNTVGSKEGWKPSDDVRREQTLNDFMDEQDYEEWGGPTAVRQEYASAAGPGKSGSTMSVVETAPETGTPFSTALVVKEQPKPDAAAAPTPAASVLPLDRLFQVSHQAIGPRLLRRLGWREEGSGSSAYVKDDIPNNGNNHKMSGGIEGKDGEDDTEERSSVLSSKRLRKIQLQQTRIKLPPPKLDQCGLGFDAYADAPEFQRYRERRKQLAHDRAHGGNAFGRNVYRTSHITTTTGGGDNNDSKSQGVSGNHHHRGGPKHNMDGGGRDDPYVSYETVEDFVGKKSVGGFAMRDDEDDAYDDDDNGHERSILVLTDPSKKMNSSKTSAIRGLSRNDFNTEIYEHVSSDDDEVGGHPHYPTPASRRVHSQHGPAGATTTNDFGGILAAWADTSSSVDQTEKQSAAQGRSGTKIGSGLMTNGRPPPAGFVLGGAVQSHIQRFPGPDIPVQYHLERHVFGVNEHPLVFQTLSRAVQLELQDERHQQQMQQAREEAIQEKDRERNKRRAAATAKSVDPANAATAPMAGGRFSGLAAAMKSRFTTGADTSRSTRQGQENGGRTPSPPPIGLHLPRPQERTATSSSVESISLTMTSGNAPAGPTEAKEIKLSRTVQPFAPHPLLCNRLHVPVPRNVAAMGVIGSPSSSTNNNNQQGRWTEAAYFEKEILVGAAGKDRTDLSNPKSTTAEAKATTTSSKPRDLLALATGSLLTSCGGGSNHNDAEDQNETKGIPRAPLETLKSIFEPESESESSEEEQAENEPESSGSVPANEKGGDAVDADIENGTTGSDALPSTAESASRDQLVVYERKIGDSEGQDSEEDQALDGRSRHHKKRHRRSGRSKRSRSFESSEDGSSDSDNVSSSDDDGRRHHRRRKKERRRERKRKVDKKKRKRSSSKREPRR